MTHSQTQAYFIAGTDTEIGKTLISSALIWKLAQGGHRVAGMKPVASGAYEDNGHWCNDDVASLKAHANVSLPGDTVNAYLMHVPTAPHIAAASEGVHIDLETIRACFDRAQLAADQVIVEGVGGFLVPLNDKVDTADMAVLLDLPVILVVGIRLGCINHALLTAQAIKARGLHVAGWVANCVSPDMLHIAETVQSIQCRLQAPMLGCVPYLASPSAEQAAAYIALPGSDAVA